MFAAAALVVLLGGAEAGAGGGTPGERAERAARRVLGDDFQRELPFGDISFERGDTPEARDRQNGGKPREPRFRSRDDEGDRVKVSTGGGLASVLQAMMIVVAAVALVMLLMWLFRDLRRGDPSPLESELGSDPTVDQDVLNRPIGDADELARAGRYAEAIHTLLLRTLVELVRATRTRVPAALTSREILARVPLVPPARVALDALVAAVEVTHFGDEIPGAADYERCRGEFQRFADAYRGGAP